MTLAAVLAACGTTVPLSRSLSTGTGLTPGGSEGTQASGQQAIGNAGGSSAASSLTPGTSASGSGPAGSAPRFPTATGTGAVGAGGPPSAPPIKVAYTIWDTTGFTAVTGATGANGSADNIADDEREMKALVTYANATGGVGGRRLAPPIGIKVSTTDGTNQNTLDSYCAQAADDDHADVFIDRSFMVSDESVSCFAKHHVTLVSFLASTGEALYRASWPYAASTSPSTERTAAALVAGLPQTDYLKGATIGVMLDDTPGVHSTFDKILAPGLRALGANVKDEVYVNATDSSQASSQGAAAVLKFRTEGIDHVIWFANFLSLLGFTNDADSQQYRPRYAFSDYGGAVGEAGFYVSPTQNANALAFSALPSYVLNAGTDGNARALNSDYSPNDPNMTPGLRNCLNIMSKYAGYNYYSGGSPRSTEFQYYCDNFLLWLDAARKVGAGVTPQTWGEGLRALGSSYPSTINHATDFTSRADGSSDFRIGVFSNNAGCKCFVAIKPWQHF